MSAEDRIHRCLLLGLAVLAGVVLGRGHTAGDGRGAAVAAAVAPRTTPPAEEVARADLDAPIERLKGWVTRTCKAASSPSELRLCLQGLGFASRAVDPTGHALLPLLSGADPTRDLSLTAALARLPGTPSPGEPRSPPEADVAAPLALLLEAGVPMRQTLPLATGDITLGANVKTTLDRLFASPRQAAISEPSTLDLLSLATLAGLDERRATLADLTQAALSRLDRQQRAARLEQGHGTREAADLKRLAEAWRDRPGARVDLQLSAALFRAVAVLADPQLETQARRHLNALLVGYETERVVYAYLLDTAGPSSESSIRLEAVERLGRLEQALYAAHLAFRRQLQAEPAPHLAQVMRQAAHDLIEQLGVLERAKLLDAPAATESERLTLLRAAVHALRGLRTARAA